MKGTSNKQPSIECRDSRKTTKTIKFDCFHVDTVSLNVSADYRFGSVCEMPSWKYDFRNRANITIQLQIRRNHKGPKAERRRNSRGFNMGNSVPNVSFFPFIRSFLKKKKKHYLALFREHPHLPIK